MQHSFLAQFVKKTCDLTGPAEKILKNVKLGKSERYSILFLFYYNIFVDLVAIMY